MPAAALEPLAESLSGEWPVTILQWPTELEVWQHQDSLLDAMAAQLPEGPVVLVGWSLGGQIASLLAAVKGCKNKLSVQYGVASGREREDKREKIKGLITLASNPRFVANQDWPFGMDQHTFKAFQQGFNQFPAKTLKEFCLLVAKGAGNYRATAKSLQQLQSQVDLSHEVLAEGLKLLATLDTRCLLQQLTCPQLHLLAEQDALVNHQLVEWFQQQILPVTSFAKTGHYLMTEADEVASQIKQFVVECN